MKSILLLGIFAIAAIQLRAQSSPATDLPPGYYEIKFKASGGNWAAGDIIILDGGKYKTAIKNEVGDFKFSVTAQRLFFTSGPLKGLFATTKNIENKPVIIIPVVENQSFNLSTEVWAYYKQ